MESKRASSWSNFFIKIYIFHIQCFQTLLNIFSCLCEGWCPGTVNISIISSVRSSPDLRPHRRLSEQREDDQQTPVTPVSRSWPWHLGQSSLSLQINHFEIIKNCIVHNELITFTFEKRQLRQNWNSLFYQPELERDNRIISSESTILSFYFWHTSTSSSNFSDVNQCKVASYQYHHLSEFSTVHMIQ